MQGAITCLIFDYIENPCQTMEHFISFTLDQQPVTREQGQLFVSFFGSCFYEMNKQFL